MPTQNPFQDQLDTLYPKSRNTGYKNKKSAKSEPPELELFPEEKDHDPRITLWRAAVYHPISGVFAVALELLFSGWMTSLETLVIFVTVTAIVFAMEHLSSLGNNGLENALVKALLLGLIITLPLPSFAMLFVYLVLIGAGLTVYWRHYNSQDKKEGPCG